MSVWILVVDDEPSNLTMANRILTDAGYRVSCVKSGEAAVKFLKFNAPDLILLDIYMPGMDGFETLAAIRQDGNATDIPVAFFTADDDDETQDRGRQAGAVAVLKKPFVPDELLPRLRRILGAE